MQRIKIESDNSLQNREVAFLIFLIFLKPLTYLCRWPAAEWLSEGGG